MVRWPKRLTRGEVRTGRRREGLKTEGDKRGRKGSEGSEGCLIDVDDGEPNTKGILEKSHLIPDFDHLKTANLSYSD